LAHGQEFQRPFALTPATTGRGESLVLTAKQAHGSAMTIFKCPHCRTEYHLLLTAIAFRQRDHANCQICMKTMYSWNSSRVPHFTLTEPAKGTPSDV
jgi:hypothetical protein